LFKITSCWLLLPELFLQAMQVLAMGRRPESVVAELVKAVRQLVLEESADELGRRKRHCTGLGKVTRPSSIKRMRLVLMAMR